MSKTPPKDSPVRIPHPTYILLQKIQETLPGKPTLVSLMKEAVELLSKKYLPEDKKEE